jgi:tetratricopeptide (TPR) repeat protein
MKIILLVLAAGLFFPACDSTEKKRVVTEPDENLDDLIELADLYYNLDNFKEAILLFDRILKLDTTNGEFYFKRAFSKSMTYDSHGSILDYYKSIELSYRVDDATFNLACIYAATQKDSLALQYFLKAYELNPENKKALIEASNMKWRLGIIEL